MHVNPFSPESVVKTHMYNTGRVDMHVGALEKCHIGQLVSWGAFHLSCRPKGHFYGPPSHQVVSIEDSDDIKLQIDTINQSRFRFHTRSLPYFSALELQTDCLLTSFEYRRCSG